MRIGRIMLVTALAGLVAACSTAGGGSGGPSAPPSVPPTSASVVTGDFTKALLPASALPAGMKTQTYDLSTLPPGQLSQAANGLTVTPPQCDGLVKSALQSASGGKGAVLTAFSTKGRVTDTVTPAPADLSAVDSSLDACHTATVSYGVQFTGHMTITRVKPPAVAARQVIAYRQDTKFDLPPSASSQLAQAMQTLGSSEVVVMDDRGVLVTVMVSGKPGVTATALAPKALAQARSALR